MALNISQIGNTTANEIENGVLYLEPRSTLEELKIFANKIREAGGAEFLDELMPAIPQHANSCLIALNLNFDCEVQAEQANKDGKYNHLGYNPGESVWTMYIGNYKKGKKIADEMDLPFDGEGEDIDEHYEGYADIILPAKIGRVAAAFDAWLGFACWDENDKLDEEKTQLLRKEYGVEEMGKYVQAI